MDKQEETNENKENKTTVENTPKLAEDLKSFLENVVDNAVKEAGITKLDQKSIDKLPSSASVNVTGLTDKDARNAKMRKFIGNVMVKAFNSEASDAVGGTFVPVEFIAELASAMNKAGIARQYCHNYPMKSKTATLSILDSQADASWTGEGVAKDGTNDTFKKVTFTRNTLARISPVTKELLEDSGVDLIAELTSIAKNSLLYAEDKALFVGTGSPVTGLTQVTGTNEVKLAGTLTAQNALTYQKMIDLIFAIPMPTGKEKLFMHPTVWAKVAGLLIPQLNIPVSTGMDLTNPAFLGYPVVLTNAMTSTATDTTGTCYVIVTDMDASTWLAKRDEFNVTASEHATIGGVSMFETNSVAVRFEEAVDIKVVLPQRVSKLTSAH